MTTVHLVERTLESMSDLAGERRRLLISQDSIAEELGVSRLKISILETSSDLVKPTEDFSDKWMQALSALRASA